MSAVQHTRWGHTRRNKDTTPYDNPGIQSHTFESNCRPLIVVLALMLQELLLRLFMQSSYINVQLQFRS